MKCVCDKWFKNIEQVDSCIVYSTLHQHPFTGEYFSYCPWCGKKLKEEEKDK